MHNKDTNHSDITITRHDHRFSAHSHKVIVRYFDADRISNPPNEVDVCMVQLPGPFADPKHVGGAVIPAVGD